MNSKTKQQEWCAGLQTNSMIYWACWVGKTEEQIDLEKPGWSPYAAFAFRFTDKEKAKKAAQNTKKKFNLKDASAKPVIVLAENIHQPDSKREVEFAE
jgi:hypothetical protein